jgi:D-inositol-3-phosphate glycosyltransferase
LNIAMLSVHSCPVGKIGSRDTGGMSIYIRELSRELGKQGHLVDIFTRAHDPIDSEIMELGQGVRLIHLHAGEVKQVNKLRICSYLDDFSSNLKNFQQRNGVHYDLIHSHYWLSGCVGSQVQKRWNIPHMLMFHTLGAVKNAASVEGYEPDMRIQGEREVTCDCDHIIAATEQEREDLIHYYQAPANKVSVIPCGVNLQLFHNMNREMARQYLEIDERKTVLYVGRIESLKGIDTLIKAMTYLQDDGPVRLMIVGGDDKSEAELDKLRYLAASLGVSTLVDFAGLVNHEELPYFYNAADVCVIPSYYESFGLVVLESLACGTPVVANRVGIVESLLENRNTGYILDDHEPHHLAEAIAMIFKNPSDRLSIAETARETVAGFSWEHVAMEISKQYRVMLGCCEAVSC